MNSPTVAAVTTGRGVSAIVSIDLHGPGAAQVLSQIFRTSAGKTPQLELGKLYTGDIFAGTRLLDNVVVTVRTENDFAINCHGNPLIVEEIVRELTAHGIQIIEADHYLAETRPADNTIAAEGRLTQCTSATLTGAEIAAYQAAEGLAALAAQWENEVEAGRLEKIHADCATALAAGERARFFIEGCKIVLAGPPNSGKSTLMNTLAGRQRSIVTDQAGTTRDWVSSSFRLADLAVELIDTAGLDETLATGDLLEERAQQRTKDLITSADLVLYVLDATDPRPIARTGLGNTAKPAIAVLNKTDLPPKVDIKLIKTHFAASVAISALAGQGIDDLAACITRTLGVNDFQVSQPAAFTHRQRDLLRRLIDTENPKTAKLLIARLRHGPI